MLHRGHTAKQLAILYQYSSRYMKFNQRSIIRHNDTNARSSRRKTQKSIMRERLSIVGVIN